MRMDEYLSTVTEQVRCSRMHDSIAEELKDHILDQAEAFEEEGTDHDQATVWLYVNYLKRKLASVQSDLTIEGQSGGPYKLVQCGVNGHGSH